MTNTQNEFVENLKYYRKLNNISQVTLAEYCDCAIGTIGCIESGHTLPSFNLIDRIAAALKIHPADLFLRNASTTVSQTKKILLTELLPQIEDFVEKRL